MCNTLTKLSWKKTKDQRYYQDYVNFMDDIIACSDAEKVPEKKTDKNSTWYILHHGVYHSWKPRKICVVFDYSKFQETSLNDYLLAGPNLTNTLVHRN